MINVWAICASIKFPNGDLLDRNKPFDTYYVVANDANDAIGILHEEFSACNVVVAGTPTHITMSTYEYENGR